MFNRNNYFINCLLLFLVVSIAIDKANAQLNKVDTPGAGNPIIPGWFADPTIKKFGDIYYIYATTDNIMLGSGAPTVWYSKDLRNWYNYIMELPRFTSMPITNFWAPDIIKGADNKYYLYFGNCEMGCNIYGYVADSPVGPWKKLHADDKAVIAAGYPKENFPSLDAQFLEDTGGKIYGYWGTWVHYNGGYAAGELNTNTMASMVNGTNIPLSETPKPFEAAYALKKGNKYILMYSGGSCHTETYNVRYSYADRPYGPFKEGKNNPVLSTSPDGTTHGPGHHSVLAYNNEYYIVYHKHDCPFTAGGLSRQICMDKMVFENDSTISAVVPTIKGAIPDIPSVMPSDIAYGKTVNASSCYHLKSTKYDYEYKPAYATDHNNATMWKAANNSFPQNLVIDLGKVEPLERVMTEFEYSVYYYQYQIHYSVDGNNWKLYADRSANHTPGSPMMDDKQVNARYVKLTVLNAEKNGMYAALWNVKVYNKLFKLPLELKNKPSAEAPALASTHSLLVAVDAVTQNGKKELKQLANTGKMGGAFTKQGQVSVVKDELGVTAFKFDSGALVLNKPVPANLGWNGAFTVAAWVKNPAIADRDECLFSWSDRFEKGLANSYAALFYNSAQYGAMAHLEGHFDMPYKKLPAANQWHHIAVSYDGVCEKVYVDGKLDNAQNMALCVAVKKAKIRIGASDTGENYSGYLASLRMYDYGLDEAAIIALMNKTNPQKIKVK